MPADLTPTDLVELRKHLLAQNGEIKRGVPHTTAIALLDRIEALTAERDEIPADVREDVLAHIRGTGDGSGEDTGDTYPAPRHGWTCFHCGETFRTEAGAKLHFGTVDDDRPICVEARDLTVGVDHFAKRLHRTAEYKAEADIQRGRAEAAEARLAEAQTLIREMHDAGQNNGHGSWTQRATAFLNPTGGT